MASPLPWFTPAPSIRKLADIELAGPPALPQRPCRRRPLVVLALLASALVLPSAQAQPSSRLSFPGRRVGGGTRGECSARVVAHLVPPNSVYAPGSSGLVGVLQGPSGDPRPLVVEFMPLVAAGTTPPRDQVRRLTWPAAPASLVLLKVDPTSLPRVWESAYQCEGAALADDPLGFVQSGSPPARSLLQKNSTAEDQRFQLALQGLQRSCGATVSRSQIQKAFGLADVITAEWPQMLPVRCP